MALCGRVRAQHPIIAALSGRQVAVVRVRACRPGATLRGAACHAQTVRQLLAPAECWSLSILPTGWQEVEELVTEKRRRQQGGEPQWVRSTSVLMNETKTTEWSLADGSGAEMPIELPLNGGRSLLSRVMQHGGDRL